MTKPLHEKTPLWAVALTIVFAAGLALRLAYVAVSTGAAPPDTDGYAALAETIVSGEGFCVEPGRPTAYRPPGYPLFLAGSHMLFGSVRAGLWVQSVLSACVVVLAWLIARRVVGDLFAAVAGLIVAVDPFQIALCGQFMTEALFTFLATGSFFLLMRALRARRPWRFVAVGLAAGAAGVTRPEFLLFVPVAALAIAAWGRRRAKVFPLVILLASSSVFPVLWGLRNKAEIGAWVFTTTHGGYTHVLSYNEVFYSEVVSGKRARWGRESLRDWQEAMEAETAGLDELERDDYYYAKANEFAADNPLQAVRVALFGALRFWAPFPQSVPGVLSAFAGAFYLVVLSFAVGGALVVWRRRPSVRLIVYILVVETVVHMYYWSNLRMRLPFHPLLAVLAAAGVAALFARAGLIGEVLAGKEEDPLYSPAT